MRRTGDPWIRGLRRRGRLDRCKRYPRLIPGIAVETFQRLLIGPRLLVTTNRVAAEAYIGIRRPGGHQAAQRFLEFLRRSVRVLRIHSDATLEQEAESILARYADQDFSYVDAVSFALMRQRGIAEAFAFDRHFLTAGFALLPAPLL